MKAAFAPLVVTFAVLYFLLDALFLSIIGPLARRLAHLPIVIRIATWVAKLGPYATLVLFLIPIILFEPLKPLGFYLIGTRRFVIGVLVIVIGELLKIITVERLFHLSRDKLMTIRAFAWIYDFVSGWIAWLKALPPWQTVMRRLEAIRMLGHRLRRFAKSL